MKQMKRPDAPVLQEMQYGCINFAYYRGHGGEIYFAMARHGRGPTHNHPVFENGTISRHGAPHIPNPLEVVPIIHPLELGIPKIVFADD